MRTPQLLLPLLSRLPVIVATTSSYIKSITYSGTGCPSGTLSTTLSPTNTTLIQGLEGAFRPYIGPGTKVTDHSKSCAVDIVFALDKPCSQLEVNARGMNITGYLPMDVTATATVQTTYAWIGDSRQIRNEVKIQGPVRGRFGWQHVNGTSDNVVTSPAGGGTLKIIYRVVETSTDPSSNSDPGEDPQPGEDSWTIVSTLSVLKSATCASVEV